jgi:SAM-dependent methyltransferase
MAETEWYEDWFDSPYYHTLYKYRDESEAEGFIDALLHRLQPPPAAAMLDLACGKGRYSRHLASKGYEVIGVDLSERSIEYARQYENEHLSFFTHDMRKPLRYNYFDYIFNFFTSFGYFEHEKEDLKTLKNVAGGLKKTGVFVLDFFNSHYVASKMTGSEVKSIDGIHFQLHKRLEGKYVVKDIKFEHKGHPWHFTERVRLFAYEDFQRLFRQAGLQIVEAYGDYSLSPYDKETSPRLIMLANCIP